MRIGPYHVVDVAGRGGNGTVFRAKAPDGSTVAVKALRTLDEATRARFDRERRIIEGLTPEAGFVPLLDSGSSNMGPYIVMPYLGGGTLRDRLRNGALPVAETLEIARSVARALGAAHERGIVHRDLKPENLLYDEQGRLYVSDLGLSKHFRADVLGASQSVALSGANELRGTVVYMPPEQFVEARTVGPPGDVFSLGLILWECLAGRAAYVAPTIVELLNVRTEPVPPIASVRSDVPAWFAAAIDKAVAHDPALRHEDGHAFARALAGPRPRAPSRVLVATLLFALPAVAALGAAAVSVLTENTSQRPAPPPAPRPTPTPPKVDPKIAEADREEKLGDEASSARRSEEAIEHFTRVIVLDPTRARAYRKRAEQENGGSSYRAARDDARRAIELDPKDARAYIARAWATGALGEGTPQEHLADYEHAIRLDPSCAGAYLARALGYAAIDENDPRILADLDHCLEIAPDLDLALFNRAAHRWRAGRKSEALADITRAIDTNPAPFFEWRLRAMIRLDMGDARGAYDDAQQALQRAPGDSAARNTLEQARKRLGSR